VTTVLLVLDVQEGIVARYGAGDAYLTTLRSAIRVARANAVPVGFVRVGFRTGSPEISPHNVMFARLASRPGGQFAESSPASQIHHLLGADPAEPVVVKKRVSAFAGSDLAVLLRSLGASHLVLAGVATSGVVLSTVREAADLDYEITVLSDGCLDADPLVHSILLERIFPSQAAVLSVEEWTATFVGQQGAADGEIPRNGKKL
jgi:nicotinamidase-related amidase